MILTIPKDVNFAYRPVRETPEQMKTSFFFDVYRTAERHIDTILELSKSDASAELPVEHSNIIAFTGGRGEGKTSAMGNFSNLLHTGKRLEGPQREREFFECLPMIDPSHISPDETVIDIVLSRMFNCFQTYCEHNEVVSERKRELYTAFSDTYQAVRIICQSRQTRHDIPDSLEGLQSAAAGNNLRRLMFKLVNLLLGELGGSRKIKGYLVLCVDDIDMNIQQGYSICEELRKYLSIPNVIILFSLCIDQMNDLVRQQYLKDFEVHLRHAEFPLTESVSDMSKKYLEKLIPFDRRCALPKLTLKSLKDIDICYEGEDHVRGSISDDLLHLLYEKSGLILVKNMAGTHAFLPTNLRGITHFIALLQNMDSVVLVKKDQAYQLTQEEHAVLEKNLDTLARYIREYFIIEFPEKSAAILKALLEEPQENLNLRITRMMAPSIDSSVSSLFGEKPAVGDVLSTMRLYSKAIHYDDGMDSLFSALFKVLYSIRILQTFLVDGEANEDLELRKLRLHQLLGAMIYNADLDKVFRGDKLCHDVPISEVKKAEDSPEFDNLLDELLINTVCMGRPEADKRSGIQFTPYLSHSDRGEEDVTRSALTGGHGNTFKYFIYSFLGCILSSLRTNSEQSGLTIRNAKYQEWRTLYPSPLPILSADCIDAYTTGLYRATINFRKSASNFSYAVSKGSRSLIQDIINRSCIDRDSRCYWENALKDFPFMQEEPLFEKHFLIVESEPSAKTALSLDFLLQRLQRIYEKYEGITDFSYMLSTYEFADTTGNLEPDERSRLHKLIEQIKQLKQIYRKSHKDNLLDDPEGLSGLKDQILAAINAEIQIVRDKLSELSSISKGV